MSHVLCESASFQSCRFNLVSCLVRLCRLTYGLSHVLCFSLGGHILACFSHLFCFLIGGHILCLFHILACFSHLFCESPRKENVSSRKENVLCGLPCPAHTISLPLSTFSPSSPPLSPALPPPPPLSLTVSCTSGLFFTLTRATDCFRPLDPSPSQSPHYPFASQVCPKTQTPNPLVCPKPQTPAPNPKP